MQSAGMFYQLRNQERIRYSDEHVMAPVLIAYLSQDIPFLMRLFFFKQKTAYEITV